MKLNDIINESPQSDKEQRNRAEDAYEDLLSAFTRMGGVEAMIPKANGLIAHDAMLRHSEEIVLVLMDKSVNRGAIGGFSKDKQGNDVLYLFVDLDKDVVGQLRRNEYRKTIIHEFIHVLDSYRMDVMDPTNNLSNTDYFNDPSETNAYYQEAISHFERQMSRIPASAKERYMERYSSKFEDFLELMSVMLDDSFIKYKNVKTDRALTKRLYQYWDEQVRTGRAFG